jgi:uncharacterized protein YegP (UPF0339 family)
MTKPTNSPGIHLFTTITKKKVGAKYQYTKEYYWHIISKNGREIARSSETYTRKANAVKSIKVAADVFKYKNTNMYYDHNTDSKLKCYL